MPDEQDHLWDEMLKRLNDGTLNDHDLQMIRQLLHQRIGQSVFQSGRFNVTLEEGENIHVGDRYTGATPEQMRLIVRELVQELRSFQPSQPQSLVDVTWDNEPIVDDLPFRPFVLDPAMLRAINEKLEIIEEIYQAGYLSVSQQQELKRFRQCLRSFSDLYQQLQTITEQIDRFIQEAIKAMRTQLEAIKLVGREIAGADQSLSIEQECQQAETEIFQVFIQRLENSRTGADWVTKNTESLLKYAINETLKQFPNLNVSEQKLDDFKFSLKQFLEQVSFSLYWGTYDILDSPGIPLELEVEQYETAFQSMKGAIPERLGNETIQEIKVCFDYLIDRLRFY